MRRTSLDLFRLLVAGATALACSSEGAAPVDASAAGMPAMPTAGAPSAGMAGVAGALTNGSAGSGGSTVGVAGDTSGGSTLGGGAGNATAGADAGVALDPTLLSKCQTSADEAYPGQQKIWCQLEAPNGNYDVSVDLGSDTATGSSRLAAETRHYLGEEAATAAGEHHTFDFSVNVRAEKHDGGQSAPGNILDLTIRGDMPLLRGLGFRASPTSITIFVAGDSTVCDWVGSNTSAVNEGETGWAQALAQYLKPGVAVANYADSGETAGGFYGKFFTPAVAALKSGDYVFVQFGHNDQKDANAVANYKTNLMKYVSDARAKQATPVLFTPVSRSGASDADPGFAGLDEQVRELAQAENVALIDLTALSRAFYKTVPDKKLLFADGGTHLSDAGATAAAKLVADAIKSSQLPLSAWVREP